VNHHPAAFINVIAEEGTKAEAVKYLQETWNELCDLKSAVRKIQVYAGSCAEGPTDPEFSQFLRIEAMARSAVNLSTDEESK